MFCGDSDCHDRGARPGRAAAGQACGRSAAAEGTLPEVVVDTAAQPKKAAAKKKKTAKSKGTGQATGTPTASAEPTKATGDKAETAYGPVKGYAATRSATGSKTDTPLKEIPQSISVVGAEQIRD